MATAFLSYQNQVLMMKKSRSKIFDFEFWGGIGGHLEHGELNSPMEASYREIEEETGYKRSDIEDFRLKYILLEKSNGEVRQQYVYFGRTKHQDFTVSDEGELFWIPEEELFGLHSSTLIKAVIEHYLHNRHVEDIFVGTMASPSESVSVVNWSLIKESNVF